METESNFELFKHGSVWVRADFHLHTKADKEFIYKEEETKFIKQYIEKLQEENIRVGIIANHNKFVQDEFKNLRKAARKSEILLLPAVELSVNDGANGIHSLVVFSDMWLENGQDYINQFLNIAFEGKTPDQYENENGRSSLGLLDTIKKLDGYNRDYFIVFAHVEQNSGIWNELDGGRITDFGKNEFFKKRTLGFQKVRTRDLKKKVQSWLNNWYPAEVEGSDCKSIDQIGKGEPCFLKIGDFTFEAIKYALLDYQSRVRKEIPKKYSHSHINEVFFEGGILNGKSVKFSPELNTLIGIRGSGKSSILEAIRYALDISFGDKTMEARYKQSLVEHTLGSGGRIILSATDQFGTKYEIKRILNERPEVFIKNKLQPGVSIRETIINKPIYFGQKDLSSSGDGFEKDLVEKLIGEKVNSIRKQIEEQKQKVKESAERLLKLSNIDEQKREYEHKKQDAEFRLEKFKQYGVNEKFQKQTSFESEERKLNHILSDLDNYDNSLTEFIGQYEDELKNHKSYKSKQNEIFFLEFFKLYDEVLQSFDSIKKEQEKTREKTLLLKKKKNEFTEVKQSFIEEFADTRRNLEIELKSQGIDILNLEEFPKLQNNIDTANLILETLEKQKNQKDSLRNDLFTEISKLNELWLSEYQSIKTELDKINQNNSSIKIDSIFKGDKVAFLEFMQSMFRGSNIRGTTFSNLAGEYSDFGAIYKDLDNALVKVGTLSESFKQYLLENLTTLLIWQVPNQFVIKYRDKELKEHSLGQRASALLLFILSQRENDVIIIDQPEDDLDNQTIYQDVIRLMLEMKPKTQFIFATHNANFPVLGDADQIHSCSYFENEIRVNSGSIDSPFLQKEIVNIMEGGKDAFEKRKEIYHIWKPQS